MFIQELNVNLYDPISLNITYQTEILQSENGKEQRIIQYQNPNYTIKANLLLQGYNREIYQQRWQANEINAYTLQDNLLLPRPTQFLMQSALENNFFTSDSALSEVSFILNEEINFSSDVSSILYRDIPLLPLFTDWSSDVKNQQDRGFIQNDTLSGFIERYDLIEQSQDIITLSLTTQNKEQYDQFHQFLIYLKGRANTCFIPTFSKDFVPAADIENNIIEVDSSYTDLTLQQNTQDIIIFHKDMSITPCRITDFVITDDKVSQLTIDTDTVIPLSNILNISWLKECRSESDNFSLTFFKQNIVTTTLTFRAVL